VKGEGEEEANEFKSIHFRKGNEYKNKNEWTEWGKEEKHRFYFLVSPFDGKTFPSLKKANESTNILSICCVEDAGDSLLHTFTYD
jgi:hypothetical protein